MRSSVILARLRPCFHLCAASPGMVGSAPPFQRLDQLPSIAPCWLLLSAALQLFAFSSSADPSRKALPANRVTSSSLGSGTSMTPNGFRVPKPASDATFSFASLSDFMGSVLRLQQRCLAPTGAHSPFQQCSDLQTEGPAATRFPNTGRATEGQRPAPLSQDSRRRAGT